MKEKSVIYRVFFVLFGFLCFFYWGNYNFLNATTKSSSQTQKTSQEYVYYIVQKGDTLEKIAKRYNLSVAELKQLNNLKENKIRVGQRLVVGVKNLKPKKEESKPKTSQPVEVYHVIKKGDTLESIAKKYGVTPQEIIRLNNLRKGQLKVGQKLLIKKEGTASVEKNKSLEKKEYVYHTVRKGESLDSIAQKYKVSKEEIKRLNQLRSEILTPNQRLIIRPKEKTDVSSQTTDLKITEEKEESFQVLEKKFEGLKNSPQVSRKQWLSLAGEYRRLYLLYPNQSFAPKAVLRTAQAYYQAYQRYFYKSDLNEVIKNCQRLLTYYPNAPETEEAYYFLAKIYREDLPDKNLSEKYRKELQRKFPKSPYLAKLKPLQEGPTSSIKKEVSKANKKEKKVPVFEPSKVISEPKVVLTPQTSNNSSEIKVSPSVSSPALIADAKRVLEVSPVTGEDYTRIIITLSGNFEYQTNILRGPTPRIYVDIYPAHLDPKVPKEIELKDVHLQKIRVGQFDKNVVRIVLDLNSLTSYKIFKIKDPPQLVLDLTGQEKGTSPAIAKKSEGGKKASKKKPSKDEEYINLARQFGLGIKRIVIDPGHGGDDPGAVGPTGLKEKEVNLAVAKLLSQKLKERLTDVEIIFTRNTDVFIPLIQRPAIANSKKGDLFISIHTNASPDPNARGIEVYYLNFTTDPESMRVAALENSASDKTLSDLQDLIKAVLSNTKLSESKLLAEKINTYLYQNLTRFYPDTVSRGVKYAPFLVLVGTRMPAVLVEVSFITNPIEEARLKNPHYLEMIAEGIAKGIEAYAQTLKLSQNPHGKPL
ncbi:LysM peptidoglycan-binding domain-containing protein [Thermodesulfobacterium sp. TA1]|uniref:N-acetylmuramoyl-L-alanine amidase n=1 Tax=Thermodesulfobacterium sp. TA1 TaxID=2234087 RepID=UPI001231B057|nr:N-acetylmuramoyl-L-alanine amidase [Thermodesulfobacterium sp. TA1]QER41243.1 LysM peptidoglycan-binding domain-containing protein [Thermodesulfobacterium sp. TA1]